MTMQLFNTSLSVSELKTSLSRFWLVLSPFDLRYNRSKKILMHVHQQNNEKLKSVEMIYNPICQSKLFSNKVYYKIFCQTMEDKSISPQSNYL